MSREEQIIRKRIAQLQERMDNIIAYEVEAEMHGYPISDDELANNDLIWNDLLSRRVELVDILAEIMNVDYMAAYCSL